MVALDQIQLIEFRGNLFPEWMELRQKVLREPLGLAYSDADIDAEADQWHLCGFKDGKLIAGLILLPKASVIKMRQVAVHPDFQGKGVGSQLVRSAEELAIELGGDRMVLHARESAVSFYRNLGYDVSREAFIEIGLPHFRMDKSLE